MEWILLQMHFYHTLITLAGWAVVSVWFRKGFSVGKLFSKAMEHYPFITTYWIFNFRSAAIHTATNVIMICCDNDLFWIKLKAVLPPLTEPFTLKMSGNVHEAT